MTKALDWLTICDAIDDGDLDDGLDEMARAINDRRSVVARRRARRLMRSIQIKDRVMLTNGIKPRYLEGITGVVLEIRDGAHAVVKLDELPTHRGRPSLEGPKRKVIVPFENLEKLEDDIESLTNINLEDEIGDDNDEDDEED